MYPEFLSCDWGTTSFRLRRVSGSEGNVIREIREHAGIKDLYEEAARGGAGTEADRAGVFARFLSSNLKTLLAGKRAPERALPLVISGMASSSIGWRELPYAKAPFSLDGRDWRWEELKWENPSWVGTTFLISGVANGLDIMRGEETEIIGLMSDPSLARLRRRSLLILPGTHSKHVWIDNQSVVDFRTFMTGELFEVLGRHSILRASVNLGMQAVIKSLAGADRTAFRDGVRWGADRSMAGGLFRGRTRTVLDRRPLSDNTWFLSGVLIGAELEGIGKSSENRPVILGAAGRLSQLYKLALEIVAPPTLEWTHLPPKKVEHATLAAHAIFLQKNAAHRTT